MLLPEAVEYAQVENPSTHNINSLSGYDVYIRHGLFAYDEYIRIMQKRFGGALIVKPPLDPSTNCNKRDKIRVCE